MQSHVFISYSRQDGSQLAANLDDRLQARGFQTWRDVRNIPPEKDFTATIEKAIESCSHVVVCITKDSKRDDGFVRRELQYALMEKKPILPARFENITPHIHIVNNTFVDFFKNESQAFDQLCMMLERKSEQKTLQTDDPFRPYLERLYAQIVAFLDRAVITLVDIASTPTPDAVPRSHDMILEFFAAQGFDDQTETPTRFASFHEAFEYYKGRMLLLGEPGAGKTVTLMAYARDAIAARLSDPSQPLPLLGLIPTWDIHQRPGLLEWLLGGYGDLKGKPLQPIVEAGNSLFLLDGLDELGLERLQLVDRQIAEDGAVLEEDLELDPRFEFMQRLPINNRILVTSRTKDYFEIGDRISLTGATTLQPLDDAQMRQYLATQPDLLAAVDDDASLREMLRTPLILSLFAFAYKDKGEEASRLRDLKGSPFELRDAIVSTYIRKRYDWEARKRTLPLSLAALYAGLGQVALNNAGSIEEANLLTMQDFEQTINPLEVVELATHLNILLPEADHYRFMHLMLRDHFAYPIALEQLQAAHYYDDPEGVNPARALGRIRDERAVGQLLACLESDLAPLKYEVLRALAQLQNAQSIPALLKAIGDEDWQIRDLAAEALVAIGEPAIEPLVNALAQAQDESQARIRYQASSVLSRIGQSSISAVRNLLTHPDEMVRGSAEAIIARLQPRSLDEKPGKNPLAKLRWEDPVSGETLEYLLTEGATITIGRSTSNEIAIRSQYLSRQHAAISYQDGVFMVSDLGSSNGTFVNNQLIREPFPLTPGDIVRLYVPTIEFLPVEARDEWILKTGSVVEVPQRSDAFITLTTGSQEGLEIPLTKDILTIGRAVANATWDIQIQDRAVARPHAKLEKIDGQWYINDLGSSNGTSVNNLIVRGQTPLNDGDLITIGQTVMFFRHNPAG